MIVSRLGYYKIPDILKLINSKQLFGIYETHKNTCVLVFDQISPSVVLYYPKYDRLPYKDVEGKKIVRGKLIFNSKTDDWGGFNIQQLNNSNQIMAYESFKMM